jgi:citrate lyase beta subunit
MEPALVLDGAARCAGGAVALEGRMIDRPAWRHLSMTQAAKQRHGV